MNQTGSEAPQNRTSTLFCQIIKSFMVFTGSQLRDLQIRVCSGFLITHTHTHTHAHAHAHTHTVLQSMSCTLRWISIFRAAVQLVSVLCCSGCLGPGPAHLAVRLIVSDMITELAGVYFHIYPEAANWIWFSAKRRLLIDVAQLFTFGKSTHKDKKIRFWSSFQMQRG